MIEHQEHNAGLSVEYAGVDKSAGIFHATFKHYYGIAMDHHTKAGTTSQILLLIVAAMVTLVSLDNTRTLPNMAVGATIFFIGLFGVLWARKQHERYCYWSCIAK